MIVYDARVTRMSTTFHLVEQFVCCHFQAVLNWQMVSRVVPLGDFTSHILYQYSRVNVGTGSDYFIVTYCDEFCNNILFLLQTSFILRNSKRIRLLVSLVFDRETCKLTENFTSDLYSKIDKNRT